MPTQTVHVKMPVPHIRLLHELAHKMGLDRSAVLKLALYRLGVEESKRAKGAISRKIAIDRPL